MRQRDFKLGSFKWLKEESLDDADDLPEPEELAAEAVAELEAAVAELKAILSTDYTDCTDKSQRVSESV